MSEKKTRDTIKIYEDLLTEITVALESIKNGNKDDDSPSK
jgi:hypothetical protein